MFGLGFNKHRTTQLNAQIFSLKMLISFHAIHGLLSAQSELHPFQIAFQLLA